MEFWEGFWSILWYSVLIVAFIAYIFALFAVITDIFRDHTLKGWAKAVWIVFLILLPLLTVVIYLVVRGPGLQDRAYKAAKESRDATDDYIRSVAGTTPTEEITQAKALLDQGAISAEEFEKIKQSALAR